MLLQEILTRSFFIFGVDLYKQLRNESAPQNIILSPYSVHTAMTLALMGAHGQTFTEIETALDFDKNLSKHDIAEAYRSVIANFGLEHGLSVANKLYVNPDLRFKSEFRENVVSYLKSDVETIDFRDAASAAAEINKWVEEETHGKINDAVDYSSVANVASVLINAIYFNGQWKRQFEDTKPGQFWQAGSDQSKTVPMMMSNFFYNHATLDNMNAQVVELEYKNSSLSMLIFLPDEQNGLSSLEDRLHEVNLTELDSELDLKEIQVTLPKFSIDGSFSLKRQLQKLGIERAFSSEADLTDMFENTGAAISDAFHKSFIRVSETGTEAGAVSTDVIDIRCTPVVFFNVDRPFLFMLWKRDSRIPVFIGSVRTLLEDETNF